MFDLGHATTGSDDDAAAKCAAASKHMGKLVGQYNRSALAGASARIRSTYAGWVAENPGGDHDVLCVLSGRGGGNRFVFHVEPLKLDPHTFQCDRQFGAGDEYLRASGDQSADNPPLVFSVQLGP